MKRATARNERGYAYFPQCFEEPCNGFGCLKDACELLTKGCERLAQYEETGLAPEQIRQIDELYKEKCKELSEERKKHEWIPADQPPNIFDEHDQSEDVLVKLEWYDKDITYSIGWYSRKYGWSDNERSVNVISWMPLPWMELSELYQTEGAKE